jgi:branched-chain amino acid transport system ATP-binding protein
LTVAATEISVPPPEQLRVTHLSMRFGGLLAVDDLSFVARAGQITALIGPNGAGKTTVFNCVTGFYRPTGGHITLECGDRSFDLERLSGHRIARDAGVVRTFQNIRLFPRMTVLENLLVAQHAKLMRASAFSLAGLFGLRCYRRAEAQAISLAENWLTRLALVSVADRECGTLAYGVQRKIEIARAMCTEPRLLCLDEPAAGLNPRETAELSRLIKSIRDEFGIGVLLIEHDMGLVMGISDRVVVLDHGACIAEGRPSEVRSDPAVIRAYLGEEDPRAGPGAGDGDR